MKNTSFNFIRRCGCAVLLFTLMAVLTGRLFAGGGNNQIGFVNGIYAAEGFGANYYYGARFAHLFGEKQYFVEAALGFGSLESRVLNDLAAFQVFDSQRLMTYEFLFGYDIQPLANVPYLVLGVANLNQGGQSKFAYVVGVGKQFALSRFFNVSRLSLRYDLRDHIFSQRIREDSKFTAHNLMFTFGLSYEF